MNKLGLTESGENVLIEELQELRETEMEYQRIAVASGIEDGTKQRSNGQLLYIAMFYAIEHLKEKNKEMSKRLEEEKHVGSKYIRTDG